LSTAATTAEEGTWGSFLTRIRMGLGKTGRRRTPGISMIGPLIEIQASAISSKTVEADQH